MNDELDAKICSQRTESKSQLLSILRMIVGSWTPKYAVKELKANHNGQTGATMMIAAGRQNMQSKN